MLKQLHVDQIDTISFQAKDAAGTPVPFVPDVPPVWTNSNPAAATLVTAADGLSSVLTPVGKAGDVTSLSAVIKIGGTTFTTTDDYSLVAGAVASVEFVDTFAPKP